MFQVNSAMNRKMERGLKDHSLLFVPQSGLGRRRGKQATERCPCLSSSTHALTFFEVVTQGLGPNAQPLYTWDEFGFRVEEEDGPEDTSSKLLSIPFTEVFLKHDDDAMMS